MARLPFSKLSGGLRLGADYFERECPAAAGSPAPLGLVDSAAELMPSEAAAARLHPAARRFLERTSELDLVVSSRWSGWFRWLWRGLLRPIFGLVGQLQLPVGVASIRTRVVAIDAARDGRPTARGVVRTYADTGRVMQLIAYAAVDTHDGPRMSAALPLPSGNLTGVLRLEPSGEDAEGRRGFTWTTLGPSGGVWFTTGWLTVRLPLQETLRFWAPGMRGTPPDLERGAGSDCVLMGRHEQRLFGALVARHDYWFQSARR